MHRRLLPFALAITALSQTVPHPTGNRTTPPTLRDVQPRGIARGTTAELTLEGFNLAGAREIYFSEPGVKGKVLRVKELPDLPDIRLGSNGTPSTIDLGPLPPRNQVTVEVEVSSEANIGPVDFRVLTPLGTSPMGRVLIEPYYGEAPDREPNNQPEDGFDTYVPAILVGEISRPGDVDYYKIRVEAGQNLVFENGGAMLNSTLQPVIRIFAEDRTEVAEFLPVAGQTAFAHKFDKAGTYYVQVSDYLQSGRTGHIYRIKAGEFPVVTSAFPLGVRKGEKATLQLSGYGLAQAKAEIKGEPTSEDSLLLRPVLDGERAFNELKLAVGIDPEVLAVGSNTGLSTAQAVSTPVMINGILDKPGGHYYKFKASKGQKFVLEVNARRLGSELDSSVEVLDAKGQPIERATLRAVQETSVTLRDHDSVNRGIRLTSYTGLQAGDYMLIGAELTRIDSIPLQPDADTVFKSFGTQRLAYLGTTPEAHALDQPVYKVQIHPAGTKFASNGLPITRLYYRNDDGGPGFGKDSYLEFTAPADGEYVVKLSDIQGQASARHTYRLNIRQPRPDIRLAVTPRNPNVPVGGSIPLTVTALRLDGYDGPVDVSLEKLAAGFSATKGVIAPGEDSTTVLLSASAETASSPGVPLVVAGKAGDVIRYADPDDNLKLIAAMPKADVAISTETREVVLAPGATAEVKVAIERQNGFGGRVPVEVRNLPSRVRLVNVGLNGVLINENENERSFTIEALPSAQAGEQLIYVSAKVETRSPLETSYAAPTAIRLRIVENPTRSDVRRDSINSNSARK